MTTILNPAGYAAPKAVRHIEVNDKKITGEGQLLYGKKPTDAPRSSIWLAPSENAAPIEKTYISGSAGASVWHAKSKRRIPIEGEYTPTFVNSTEVEIDGERYTFTDRSFTSGDGWRYEFRHNLPDGKGQMTLALRFHSDDSSWGNNTTQETMRRRNYLGEVEIVCPESITPSHIELLAIRGTEGTEIKRLDNAEAGLYLGAEPKQGGNGYFPVRLDTSAVVWLDDERSVGDYRLRNYAAGQRILYMERRGRFPLRYETKYGGYVYRNTAFSDEALKTVGSGKFRLFLENDREERYLGANYGDISLVSNNWATWYGEYIDGINFTASFVNDVLVIQSGGLREGYRLGIYSLTIGDKVISDDPTVFYGARLSLGGRTFYKEISLGEEADKAIDALEEEV